MITTSRITTPFGFDRTRREPRRTATVFAWLLAAFALSLSSVQVAAANGYQDTIKRSFDVRPGGVLYLDVDRGNVEIETSTGNEVHVVLERDVTGASGEHLKEVLERHEWLMERDGDDVVVESRFDQDDGDWSWRSWKQKYRFRLQVRIQVPREYNVDFHTGAGNVTIADLRGYVDGRTGAGNLTIGRIDGRVDVTSGSGNVDIEGAVGEIRVQSGAGNITLDRVHGDIRAATGAGNIRAYMASQPDEDSRLESGAGNVTVYLDEDIGLYVDANASVGSAECDFDLRVRGKWMSKSFAGEINGGGPELTLRSGVGNVILRRR